MEIQVMEDEDEILQEKVSNMINRIRTIASIHELLYQSDSFSQVDVGENIEELVDSITTMYNKNASVDLDMNIQDLELNINQAIPFSLIANEVLTNIMKHAFSQQEKGTIKINLTNKNHEIFLSIEDDGCGLPDNFNELKNNSLGLQLIDSLTHQLCGSSSFKRLKPGTRFELQFEKDEVQGAHSMM
jgi:two-component sensor histidine kinase